MRAARGWIGRGGPYALRMGGDVGFGFLGAGWIARRALAPAVHAADGAVLAAVAARDPARAAALEPRGRAYDDYRAVLDDPTVDVVYVNLSNESHLPWTLAALDAGKHVLCEKPLGLDTAEVAEMADAALAADRLLVEAFWYRWHPRTRRLERLLASGALGPVRVGEAEFSFDGSAETRMAGNYRLDPSRGGGALYDVGCYAVSATHLMLGPALAVERAEARHGETGVDVAAALWLSPAPADGAAERSRGEVRCGIAGPDRQVLRVSGEVARLDFAEGEAFTSWHQPSSLTITTPDGAVRVEEFTPVDPYRLMVEAVAARIRGQEAFLVDLGHSRSVAATLQAARAGLPRSRG